MSSMPESVIIFKDLPATFPEKDKYRKPSVIGSVVFHGLLILTVLIVPLLLPQSISERQLLITLVSPIGPPLLHHRQLSSCPLPQFLRWRRKSDRRRRRLSLCR